MKPNSITYNTILTLCERISAWVDPLTESQTSPGDFNGNRKVTQVMSISRGGGKTGVATSMAV